MTDEQYDQWLEDLREQLDRPTPGDDEWSLPPAPRDADASPAPLRWRIAEQRDRALFWFRVSLTRPRRGWWARLIARWRV